MPAGSRALSHGLLGLAALLAAACVAPPAGHDERAKTASPSLEDIFLLPGIHGEAPRVVSVSYDGRFALVDWRPVVRGSDGKRAWGADLDPHLLSTASEDVVPGETTSLVALLEDAERARHASGGPMLVTGLDAWKPKAPSEVAWSRRGHMLAAAWERGIVVIDPEAAVDPARRSGAVSVVYADPPPEKEAANVAPDGAEGAKPAESPRDPKALPERLGDVQSIEFTQDDTALAVRTRDELFLFPLGRGTLALADAEWPTKDVETSLGGLQWSEDRTRYFSRGKALREIAPAPGDADTRAGGAQFLDLAAGRAVVLEGMREIAKLENARMSPGGDYVFAAEADRSKEPAPTLVPNYLTERVSTIEARRELADDAWPPRKLWMWSTADGARRRIALPGEDGFVLQDVGWAPKGEPRFALRRLSSDYRTLETWIWSARGPVLALVDRDEHWVGGPAGQARWSRDGGRLLFGSECTASSTTPGRNQVFALDPRTGAVAQLTEVEGEVTSWVELEDGSLAIVASRDDPARREIARVLPGPPPRTEWLDVRPGANEGLVAAAGGSRALFLHQELGLPGEIHVAPLDRSAPPHALTRTIPDEYLAHDWIKPVRFAATHADGTRIRAHVTLPRETSLERPDRPRPCVVFIHGAGYLQNVTDSMSEYAVNQMFHSRLATLGYVVADVDYRGSAGYGAKFRGAVQFQLGKLELEDIAAVLDRLGEGGVIDRHRVACYGGSYGGFLTLMALFTEPDRWTAGAALRSVTDWRTYHPGYTQPRLGRPSTNPEAYARSSPIDHAQNLKAPLLLLHGMTDTNVFAQDSIRLIEKLVDLGLEFDAMLYPSQGHGFTDGMHWLDEYRRIERFLAKHLGEP